MSHGVTTCFMCIVERLNRLDHILFNYCYVVEVSYVWWLGEAERPQPRIPGKLVMCGIGLRQWYLKAEFHSGPSHSRPSADVFRA